MDTSPSPAAPRSRFAFFLILFASLAVFSFGFRSIANSEVWMHLASGRVIAQQGLPHQDPFSYTTDSHRAWINPTWLYDVGLFKAWDITGPVGVVFVHAALGLLAFLLAGLAGRTRLTHPAAALALLASGWLIAPLYHVGPALAGLTLAGLTMFILARKGTHLSAWLILVPSQLIWTNLHGSFLLGPLMAVAYGAQAFMDRKRQPAGSPPISSPLSYGALALVLLLITLINPFGLALHRQVLAALTNPSLGAMIEWISPYQTEFGPTWARHASTVVLILVACGFIFVRERLPVAITSFAVVGAFLLVISPRFVGVSALLVLPFIALSAEGLARVLHQSANFDGTLAVKLGRFSAGLLALLCLGTLFYVTSNRYFVQTGSAASFGAGIEDELIPTAACETVIKRADFPKTAINLAMDGGYLAWKVPGYKVFADPRVAVYGAAYYQGLARALLGQTDTWNNLVSRWQPGAVILNCSWPGAGAAARRLVDEGRWAMVYFDGISAILVLRTSEHKALISDLEAQVQGLSIIEQARKTQAASRRSFFVPANPTRLMGAGSVYLALWRFREAEAVYKEITATSPNYVTGWLNFGITSFQRRHMDQALLALEQARRLRPDSALTWLWLSKTYEAKGLTQEAVSALQKARSINEGMANAFVQGFQTTTNKPMPGTLNSTNR